MSWDSKYKYYHVFTCGHRQRTNDFKVWQWMRGQILCKACNEVQNMSCGQTAGQTATAGPPLGLRPAKLWNVEVRRQRAVEITQAMQRYAVEGKEIPVLWYVELAHQLKLINASKPTAPTE